MLLHNLSASGKSKLLNEQKGRCQMNGLESLRLRSVWLGVVVCIVVGGEECTKADFFVSKATCVDQVINNGTNTQECSFLHDGLKLYFTNSMPGGYGGHDIWVASRESPNAPWEEPVNLGPSVNSGNPCYPAISPDELELYFQTSWNSTVLMRSTRASKVASWGPPELFTGLGSNACDLDISADGLTVYFDSAQSGGYGGSDIWMATRETVNAPWGEPVNLGPNVNDARDQVCPSISNDGLALFYNNGGLQHISVALRASTDGPWGPAVLLGPAVNGQSWNHGAEVSPDGSVLYFDSGRSGGFNAENFWQVKLIPAVDFNGDGRMDGVEVCRIADCWGTDDSVCDIGPMPWGDGVVDVQDLIALAEYIGQEVNDPTLLAHWALDETEGMVAYDSAGDCDGTVIGVPAWQPEAGKRDGALKLDGATFLAADHVLSPSDGPFSVLVWMKDGEPGQVVVSQEGAVSWLMADVVDGVLKTELRSPTRLAKSLTSTAVITDGDWHRVGFVWDGSTRRLCVDDVVVAEDTQAELAASLGGILIGCGGTMAPGSFFSGLIDDVRIYSRAVRP